MGLVLATLAGLSVPAGIIAGLAIRAGDSSNGDFRGEGDR
jgi:hypothetical protein